jgi:hypothetical protein
MSFGELSDLLLFFFFFFFFLSFALLQRHPSHSDEMCSLPEGLNVPVEFFLQWGACWPHFFSQLL